MRRTLDDFRNHKTFYDAAFLAARRAEVAAAKLLPDDQARGEAAEVFRIQMKEAADAAKLKWNTLRSYIEDAFSPELVKPKLEAAGYLKYETAADGDWEDMKDMLTAGSTFIDNNNATLTAPGGMPAGFPAAYSAAMTTFNTLYQSFMAAQQGSEEGTSAKVIANNLIYTKLMKMFDDGQIIYHNNAAKRVRFIFANVKALVSTPNGGGTLTVFEGTVNLGENKWIDTGTTVIKATTDIELKNPGQASLNYYFASGQNQPPAPGAMEIIVNQGDSNKVEAQAMGWTPATPHLHVRNPVGPMNGSWRVVVG